MATGFDLQHYNRVAGFLDLSGDSTPCGLMYDTRVVCKSAATRDTVLARLIALGPAIETSGLAKNGAILTWMAFASQDHDNDARIFARFRDKTGLDAYNRLSAVLEFWAVGKENDIDKIEQRGYVENGKGWLHR
ncbi:hypothetical protein SPI_09190 [Niveomyces insectorum RCEF 264]|uniref:Uncharacterized protein n=1 Tax=Niveomyces insectorum RCEF 264 TaxID=1081102 RepID=A0A167M688_9HYPO|nr:hypothetical protein SPI_09190 [Niveomyces insectorum RCEF 264]